MAESEKTVSVTIPPPVGGWNTLQPISEMEPIYAVEMINYLPNNGTVDLRKGSAIYKDISGAAANRLRSYISAAGSPFLLMFSSTAVKYVNSSGSTADVTGTWTGSGNVLYSASHAGYIFAKGSLATAVYSWAGTGNFAAASFTKAGAGNDTTLYPQTSYKGRLYFNEAAKASVWYTPTIGQVTGSLTEYSVAPYLPRGGDLIFIGSISPNTNNLREAYLIIISTAGDVLVYQGDSPEDSTWYLTSQYFIGAPVGPRAFVYFQNDLLVITYDGIVSINAVMNGSPLENSYLTNNIQAGFRESIAGLASITANNYCSGFYYPQENIVAFAIPVELEISGNLAYDLLTFNTVNKAWAKIRGWDGYEYANFQNKLYFITFLDTDVIQAAFTGYFDEDPNNPGTVVARETKLRCAFNYLGDRSLVKTPTQAVPILYESEGLSLTIDCDIDYSDTTATSTVTDTTDTSYKLYKPTCGLTAPGSGKAVSIRLDGSVTTKRRSIQAVEVYYKSGGIR